MLRSVRLLPMLAALCLVAFPALAWGPEGHAIVADIAQRHLSPAALREVHQLLALEGKQSLDQVASWADEYRQDHRDTGPWHYVDIPLDASGYAAARDCPRGNCVVARLPYFVHVLANRSATPQQRLVALKWVVHLVGDIHQPLHNEDHDDKGGNTVQLVYFGKPTNLHRIWDSAIIEHELDLHMQPDYSIDHAATRVAAVRMDSSIDAAMRKRWLPPHQDDSIEAAAERWSDHSHMLARTVAYADLPGRRERRRDKGWSKTYQQRTWPVVKTQLEAAGVRLADVLNGALGG